VPKTPLKKKTRVAVHLDGKKLATVVADAMPALITKKGVMAAKARIKKIEPPPPVAETEAQMHDRISRQSEEDVLQVPGSLSDWLSPNRKKDVLDPALRPPVKARIKKGPVRPPVADIPVGHDGLPGRGR
jgi:hypothetical protein